MKFKTMLHVRSKCGGYLCFTQYNQGDCLKKDVRPGQDVGIQGEMSGLLEVLSCEETTRET